MVIPPAIPTYSGCNLKSEDVSAPRKKQEFTREENDIFWTFSIVSYKCHNQKHELN